VLAATTSVKSEERRGSADIQGVLEGEAALTVAVRGVPED
jgi:hypothetical protein